MRRVKRPARIVIITGARAGVGRAIAHRFAREGDRVGLIARGQAALREVQRSFSIRSIAPACHFLTPRLDERDLAIGAIERTQHAVDAVAATAEYLARAT